MTDRSLPSVQAIKRELCYDDTAGVCKEEEEEEEEKEEEERDPKDKYTFEFDSQSVSG